MRLICAMILQSRHAKKFAGEIVREMIRLGADADLMRKHDIPNTVFLWTLGGQAWIERNPKQCAEYCCRQMRYDFLFKANKDYASSGTDNGNGG